MGIINRLIKYFTERKKEVEPKSPVGTCPVCWGYQNYDNEVRNMSKNRYIDIKNHQDKYMKLQKFMVEHVEDVKNKKVRSRPFKRKNKIESGKSENSLS